MKLTQFSRIVAIGSLGSAVGFLASCKESKTESADQPKKPATENSAQTDTPSQPTAPDTPAATSKVPIYIVTVNGSG